jgi:hypothetical protein
MAKIMVGESHLSIAYRFEPGDGTTYCFWVSVISPEQSRDIVRGVDTAYALVVPLQPQGYAYPFLRGQRQDARYVSDKTGLRPYEAALLAYILPALSAMDLPDVILQKAVEFVQKVRDGDITVPSG